MAARAGRITLLIGESLFRIDPSLGEGTIFSENLWSEKPAQVMMMAVIDPVKPWQNGVNESFNGKFRDECPSMEWFYSRTEAKGFNRYLASALTRNQAAFAARPTNAGQFAPGLQSTKREPFLQEQIGPKKRGCHDHRHTAQTRMEPISNRGRTGDSKLDGSNRS